MSRARVARAAPRIPTAWSRGGCLHGLLDTHAHVGHLAGGRLARMLERARAAGVERLLAVGGSPEMNAAALRAARDYPGRVRAAVGWDREQAGREPPALDETARSTAVAAIGEIGLDYYYQKDTAVRQQTLFREMLSLAYACRKPVVVHSRAAEEDTLALLKAARRTWPGPPGTFGVLHCFTGSVAFAAALLSLDMMIGFSGIVTFCNAGALREVARLVPGDRMLIETDAPYLAPVPYRGVENEPAFICRTVETLAAWRGCAPEQLAEQTARNAEQLFGPW